ncbi:Gfo/Idh/MocA family protein [Aquirufa sp. ROCK-SH2]
MMNQNRRDFLNQSLLALGAIGTSTLVPLSSFGRNKIISANDKIHVGLIGCKGQGWSDLMAFLKNPEVSVVALCDVDANILNQRKADLDKIGGHNPTLYNDYRRLLESKNLDFVIIATPDHWHCLQLTDTLSAGFHAYCEKPIANSIAEAQVMLKAAERSKKIIQINQWQRSQQHFKDAVDFVQSGKLGNLLTTKTWMYRGNSSPLVKVPSTPVPAGVDYAKWLGPATKREFNANRFHYEFRWFWDYAGGLMTDWGVHLIDIVLWATGVEMPKSVMATGAKIAFPDDARETPDYLNAVYDYGKFTMSWENILGITGGLYGKQHGIAFVGSNGTLVVNRNGWEVIPEKDGNNFRMEAVALQPKVDNGLNLHAVNFLDALKANDASKLNCPIQAGARVAINSHMGNMAYRVGEKIHWDAKLNQFNSSKANQLIKPTYHNGYQFPRV